MKDDQANIDQTREYLRTLGAMRGPIIVGPWLSEVGYELLYWVPFLRWAVRLAGLHAEDLYVVSRGGAGAWYQDIGAHYHDVLDFYTPEEFRAADDRRIKAQSARAAELGLKSGTKSPKQQMVSEFDEDIIRRVCWKAGITRPRLLHPSLMYRFYRSFWKGHQLGLYAQTTRVGLLRPAYPVSEALPKSYVAMKFYSSAALPDTPVHRLLISQLVETQAKTTDVVLLHRRASTDDHRDFHIEPNTRIHRVELPPARNLDIQTSIISGAESFIGTYGGFSYLAPFLGVPALGLYAKPNWRKEHWKLMTALAKVSLRVPFEVDTLARGKALIEKRVRRAA